MKCIVITVFSAMLFNLAEGIDFGFKAGINIANFHGDYATGFYSRIGYSGGSFFIIGLSNTFAIQPEVLYAQKGGKWQISIRSQGYFLVGTFIYDSLRIQQGVEFG